MPTNIQANLTLNTAPAQASFNSFTAAIGSAKFAQPLGRISGDAAEFTKSLSAATARVTAFGLTAGAIYKVSQAIREGAKATIEVDKQLVELNTYLGKSRNELEGFSQSLFKVAKNSAVPFEAAAEAAKEFARQGLSANEILKRTGSALTLARIAGISYAQAVNGITTAINSFNKEALTSEDITNKLIAVDTRFAVSSAQLNEALSRVGSSAEESGLSIDKLIATVTAAQQITGRGGAVIGNALKTIFTRLQRPEVLSQLEMLGVAVKDQNGYLLDGISILKNYSDATKNLSQTEKSRTAELVGGIYQINQVNALIKDLSSSNSIYADALRVSSAATDEAKKKNEELNKSLSAVLQQTKTSAQEAAAALGSSLLDPLVKLGSTVSEVLLKLVSPNSDLFGQGEDSGKKFADGLRKGAASILGKTLGAGGLPILAATGGLLAAKFAKFGVSSLKQLGRASSEMFTSEKELQIQKRINDTLRENPAIIDSVISRKMNLAQAEAEVLRLIQEQNRSLLTQSRITGRVTSTVSTAQKASKRGIGRLFAEGYIPDTGVEAAAFQLEENTARRMGAVNPKAEVVQATIQGKTGPVIVNDKEKIIPNYGGTGETAIIPNYRNLDEIPRMSKGYIPNFAWSKSNKMPKDFLIKYPQSKAAIKAGRMYSPEVRAMLQKLQTGEKIDRDLLDALIERDIPIREVIAPSSAKDLPSQALIKNALDKEQAKRANKLSELPAGSEITVRQDVPSMTRKGVGVVKTESSGGFKSYDSFVAFDNPVMGKSAGLERASLNIGAGKEKSPLLKISGTLSKDQSLPKDLKNWTQVGYNPDRHSYYYDRKTKKPIVGGQQAIQIGNTVFVKEAISGNREDFSYAKGYIPNFAKQRLGGGFFGEFFGLRGSLGRKDFFDPKSNRTKTNVANEYVAAQELGQMIGAGQLNPIFKTPEIYGSLEKSIQKSSIYKKVIAGKTGKDLALDLDPYTGERQGFDKFYNLIAGRAQMQIDMGGRMKADDLVGKYDNLMFNEKSETILSKVLRRNYGKLIKSIESKDFEESEAQMDRILTSIAKKGGEINIVDTGVFGLNADLAKKRTKGLSKLGYKDEFAYGPTFLNQGYIPNFAKRKDVIQRIGKKEIFARFQKHFEKGKDYQRFYEIHAEEYAKKGLSEEERRMHANITSAISPRLPDYVAAQFSGPIFNRFMETRSTNVDDYLDVPPAKKVSRHATLGGTGDMGRKGEIANSGKPRNIDDIRRLGLSKALRGLDLGSHDTAKTRHYARAILQDKTAFPIDTNVIQAILGGKNPTPNEAAKLISLANEFAGLHKIGTGAAGLQAAIFKSNSKFSEAYTPDTVRSALSGIKGRAGGYVPNFANPRIVGQGSNLFVSSLYDTLSGEHGGGPEYPFARPGMGAAFLNKEKTNDMIKLIKPFVESGSRVIFGAQAGRMGGDLGLIQGLAGNKMVVEALKASYPKLTSKFIQEGTSTANLTSLFDKFYKTLGPDKMREIVSPFIEPDILKFYQKNKNFGSSISRLAEFGSESLTQASSSQHSIYPAAIRGKALSRIEPVNAQKLFQTAGGLSDKETKKLFGTVRVAKLPIGFRFEKGDAASKLLGLSQGYIPNFASTFNAEKIKKMGGYVGQANKASAPGLYNILNSIGIPIELDNITKKGLTDTLSSKENKLKLYNFLKQEPIEITNYPDSYSEVKDGNHRFTLAQFAGIKNIPAKYKDNFSGGYIPNFTGLSKAVSREKTMSGLPASQIMAHFDGVGNPVAVTNKRDEPNGLKDVPNFALPSRQLVTILSRLGLLKGRNNLANPISAGVELFAGSAASSTLDTLAENELIDPRASTFANVAIPGAIGLKNIGKGIFGKGSKTQRGIAIASGVGQLTAGTLAGFQGGADLGNRINIKKFEQALDRSKKTFQDLTENTLELSNSLAKLDDAYRDPKADPKQILKLSASIADLLSKVKGSNPGLVSKLASETTLAGKQAILEDNAKESQRIQSVRQEALKFSSKGTILGKDAPKELDSFFRSVINSGNQDLLKQDLSKAGPANFSEVLSKGGLNVQELSSVFKTDELKKGFLDALKLTQKLNEISSNQEAAIIDVSKPLTRKKQQTEDRREIRSSISKALEDQLPELASFAGGFSKRAGISAASDASLAIKTTQSSVSFQNSLLAQLSDKEFTKGLPSQVQAKLNAIETPGVATGRDLESIKQLPGLSKAQVAGIEKLIQFNSLQTREIQKAGTIANETKNIQLKFLALQEKLAFGGDIKTSINPQMRAESMSAGLRGPLTYQLGTLFGSRRTQVGGATDFLTETMQKYPGLLQTKNGKEPADISGVKRELTGLNAMDMQRDLLKRANMAQMMGLGQTSGLLRNKAFDSKYLFESAGLKADALFGSPEVPGEVKSSMQDYEKFGVQSAKQAKADDSELKRVEDLLVPIKQQITEQATALGQGLVSGFEASLKSTFGDKGIRADVVNLVASQVKGNASESGAAQASDGPPVKNFANPVNDAITREKIALAKRGIMGVPNFAMASINLERSPNLATASNPQGFGVTNSIDEKNGLRSLGMRSSGYVNNFAKKTDPYNFGPSTPPKSGGYSLGVKAATIPPPKAGLFSLGVSEMTSEEILARAMKEAKEIKAAELAQRRAARAARPAGPNTITGPNDFGKSTPPRSGGYSLGVKAATISPPKAGLFSLGVSEMTSEEILARTIREGKESKAATLAQRSGLSDLEKTTRPAGANPIFARTARESKLAENAAARYAQKQADLSKLANPIYDTALDPVKRMSAADLQNRLKIITERPAFANSINAQKQRQAAAAKAEVIKQAEINRKQNLATRYFESTAGKRAEMKMFAEADAARTVAPRAFSDKGMLASRMAEGGRLEDLYGVNYGPRASAMENNYKELSKEAVNKILGIKGSEIPKKPSSYLSMGGYGPTVTSTAAPSGAVPSSSSTAGGGGSFSARGTGKNALKFLGKYGGKALGGLAGAASIYEYYEGFQEAKKDKYAGAAKMFEATGGLAISGAGLAGAGLATTLALPLAVGALGYGAIKGVEATGLLDAAYGAGYGTVGLGAIGSKSIRGMTSRTAFNDDMIVARKQEILKEINRYNSVAGNPLVSTEFQVSRSTAAQKIKDKQDLEQLNNRLDEESQATRAGITSRATAAGAAETARLNQESAAQEEARSSKLRKSFLESFDKNAEANGYTTTKDKANYLLGQEGKNGIGSFKYTDFKDQEFAKSFDIYKTAKEAEAAREANRVIPKSAIEFRDRPMPSFPQDVLEEATRTGRSAERVIQDRAESNVRGGASSQGMTTPEINAQMSRDYTADTGLPSFPKDVLEEAVRRRVTAEQVMKERAGGGVPNFAAMSNGMMSSGDVYSRMRSSAPRNFAPSYAQGSVPNFAAGDFTNAVTEALKTGITSAFPGGGGSSSTVSNSNVINIDGRSSIQNAPDEAMQGIISILFDKIPELKKLGPAALNFKK